MHLDKQEKVSEERNQAVKKVQKEATEYIIKNYSGIKTIKWQGWSVSQGPFTILADVVINDCSKKKLVYYAGGEKDIPRYTDNALVNKEYKELGETVFQKKGIAENKKGSPKAKIIYNWKESK